jgi:hypothetical protein
MGKQTNLEKKGIESRDKSIISNDFNKTIEYNERHEDAISDASKKDKPLGKGTGHGGHTHSIPDASRPSTPDYSNFDTFNGGGSYDIHGRNDKGGRIRLMTYNLYGPNNSYLSTPIDSTVNSADGQVIIK